MLHAADLGRFNASWTAKGPRRASRADPTRLGGIFSSQDWLPTFVAAAGNPNIGAELLKGKKIGDTTYKNHLDGFNQMDLITGNGPSARHSISYFAESTFGAVRIDDFKYRFIDHRGVEMARWLSSPRRNKIGHRRVASGPPRSTRARAAFVLERDLHLGPESPGDTAGLERLAQYILRCPFSVARVVRLTDDGSVIYRADQNHCRRFLAELTQHIPEKARLDPGFSGYRWREIAPKVSFSPTTQPHLK